MQTIHHFPEKGTFVYQSGRYKQARESSPLMEMAYNAAQRYPIITSRVWKAAILFEDGGVELLPEDEQTKEFGQWGESITVAKVRSRPDEPGYTVRRLYWNEPELGAPVPDKRHKFSCECFDYQQQYAPIIHGQPLCKHILATKQALKEMAQAATTITELETVVITQPEGDHEPDPETKRILTDAREKANRRRKGQLYEMANRQIDLNTFRMQHGNQS